MKCPIVLEQENRADSQNFGSTIAGLSLCIAQYASFPIMKPIRIAGTMALKLRSIARLERERERERSSNRLH